MCKKKYLFLTVILLFCNFGYASIVITNGLTHSYRIEEGTIHQGVISIQNTAKTSQNIKLYQNDYRYSAQGVSHYDEPGQNPRSNLDWIKLHTNLITVDAGGKADVLYEITVPDDMEYAGSYWSVIMVEPMSPIKPSDEPANVQIKSIVRYSIQIITTNQQAAESLLKFADFDLSNKNETPVLDVDIANEGELYHITEASLTIFDSKTGKNMGVYNSNKMSLLPNNSKRFSISLEGITPGAYQAAVVAVTNDEKAFGINIELEIPDE